ncbi:hypothetical protein AVEN_17280-1 [Araneus ventricosus]|uniref:Uncharacterized protein n=1 Tax=Araneus ventricosus TaxID=182803 RepID=A0A4Y2P936_ARAVE|nr:hypothetical protein AVEN_17280-1 [Araneus ventricosus]
MIFVPKSCFNPLTSSGTVFRLNIDENRSETVGFEGRGGSEIASDIRVLGGPIILALQRLFPCILREGYSRGVVNDHPDWESPIHVAPSPKVPVLKGLGEKDASELKS